MSSVLEGFSSSDLAPYSFLGWSYSEKNFTMPQFYCAHTPRKLFGTAATSNASIWEYCSYAIWIQLALLLSVFQLQAITVGVKERLWSQNLKALRVF